MARLGRNTNELVRRAAQAGGSADSLQRQSSMRFFSLVAAVVFAGSLMVGFAWSSRQYDHPTLFDSWENAYGVFDCTAEDFLEPFDSANNPNGIRTRSDGVIYIEPTTEEVTGDGARLDVFFDNIGASMTDSKLILPDGHVLTEDAAFCRGEEATLQVHRWDATSATEPVEIIVDDFDNIVFREDGQSFTVALAPLGSSVPKPPSSTLVTPLQQIVLEAPGEAAGS